MEVTILLQVLETIVISVSYTMHKSDFLFSVSLEDNNFMSVTPGADTICNIAELDSIRIPDSSVCDKVCI